MRRNEQSGCKVGKGRRTLRGPIGAWPGAVVSLGLVALALTGCSGAGGGAGAKSGSGVRDREIVHEPCDEESSTAERLDANGDEKPDVIIVKEGGVEVCRASDLDFDGRVDLYSYFDKAGKTTRRELDYDRDGNIDEIQFFKNGELTEKHRSTTLAKRLDTWETYTQGRLAKAERDSDGNGRVDQWWEYKTPDCPLILTDIDGNGEPDPSSKVDFCTEASYKPPEQAAATTPSMLSKETQALPTETSNEEVTEPAKADQPSAPADKRAPAADKQGNTP